MSYFKRTPKYYTAQSSGSQNISDLNWESLIDLEDTEIGPARKSKLKGFNDAYVLPQLMAWLASPAMPLVKNEQGLYSAKATILAAVESAKSGKLYFVNGVDVSSKTLRGITQFLSKTTRGEVLPVNIKKQTDKEGLRWAANVPLFLSAFKQHRDVMYSAWDLKDPGLSMVVDSRALSILHAVDPDPEFVFAPEDILKLRRLGSVYRSGEKAGTVRDATSHMLIKFCDVDRNDPEMGGLVKLFEKYDDLVRQLVAQTWIFQPSMYNRYGVSCIINPDERPEPLVSSIVVDTQESQVKKVRSSDDGIDWGF